MTSIAVGNRRLLRLAKILDTADEKHKKRGEPTYNQEFIRYTECGTPACALGHYAAQTPQRFRLNPPRQNKDDRNWIRYLPDRSLFPMGMSRIEFGLSLHEAASIFSSSGCNYARTAKQAAKYIRAFVKRRQAANKARK